MTRFAVYGFLTDHGTHTEDGSQDRCAYFEHDDAAWTAGLGGRSNMKMVQNREKRLSVSMWSSHATTSMRSGPFFCLALPFSACLDDLE